MCFDPASLALIATAAGGTGAATALGTAATVAAGAGGIISAYSQYQNAKASAAAASQAAAQQEEAAREAMEAGREKSDLRRRQGAQQIAQNQVAMAANGVDLSGEFALDMAASDKALLEEDAFAIRESARRDASGQFQAAANSRTQSNNFRSEQTLRPLGTILTTASVVGSRYASMLGAPKRQEVGGYA